MRIALLTTDNRWVRQEFHKDAPSFGQAPEALLSGFAGRTDIEVHVMSTIRKPVKSPEKLAANIWFHSLYVPKAGWMRTGYLGCLLATRRRLKMLRPDLVHGQGSEGDAAICAAYSGYPNVITLLGIMREMAKVLKARAGSFYWFASGLENMSLRRTAGVLCNSRYTQERVRRRTRKTWLVPNAIREAFFEPPARVVASAKCVLLNVGAVSSYKRQNELLDMAEQLHEEGLRFQLHFIGAANPQNCYSADFLRRVQNSSYLSYEGVKSVSELIDSYDGAAALVHVSAIETFGLVVAEALSRNLKVFGFASGGVADITQGVAGAETFSDGDWLGLKAAIANWIRAGFPRPVPAACLMKERYHPTEIAQQHLEVYREVLGTPQ